MKPKIKNELGLIPPQALEVEAAVLGALMLEAGAYRQISGIIKSESFYLDNHRIIFEVIKSLSDSNKPIDLLTVTKSLHDKNQLDEIGGPLVITQMTSRVASAAHIQYHAYIIAQLSMRRQLIRESSQFIASLYDNEIELDEVSDKMKNTIDGIMNGSGAVIGKLQPQILTEALSEMEEACRIHKLGGLAGISTGFNMLDYAIGGWRRAILAIVAARTGIGKTSLAMHFLKEAVKLDKYVVLYSFEMSAAKLGQFMLSSLSGVNRTVLRDGYTSPDEWALINKAVKISENHKIRIVDSGLSTIDQIKNDVSRSCMKGECDLVIVDYIGLVKTSSANRYMSNADRIAEISGSLKQISMSNNIPVICLAQLNREAEKFEEPQLHHLRDSGAIEQDADIVLMPYYDEKTGTKQFKLKIAKNRDGGSGGSIDIFPNDQFNVFSDRPDNLQTNYNPNRNIEPGETNAF